MTDAQIIDAIELAEGWPKFTDHPADQGGPTKGGITLQTLRVWRGIPTLSTVDLIALERPEARAIYQFMFVQPFYALSGFPKLRHYLIDLGVLRGPRAAAIWLQEIVGATADGWIGPKTMKALQPFKRHVLEMLIGVRFVHIEQRIRELPSQAVFRDGWRNRNAVFLTKED
jgi:lysozyme family protein